MPRPLRLEFENAWYHVTNRGVDKQPVFKTDKHRNTFLTILQEATDLFGIEIHAYCLMNNQYQLLVKTPRANLSRAMRHINGIYTQRFNRDTSKEGPVFRGRFKSIMASHQDHSL